MTARHIIGIDPGPIPGLVMLTPGPGKPRIDIVQCSAEIAPSMLWALLARQRDYGTADTLVQIEKFVVGRGSMRSAGAGSKTRDLVGSLGLLAADQPNVLVVQRTASQVKPWATDERLDAAGLLDATKGMRHARDAARHALFAAVKDCGFPDPLSRKAR